MLKYFILFFFLMVILPFEILAANPASTFDVRDFERFESLLQKTVESLPEQSDENFQMEPFRAEDLLNSSDWKAEFTNVIVINKSNAGASKQRLRLFQNGVLVFETQVSTGREQWEQARRWPWQKGPKRSYFSSTNIGYYTPTWIERLHKSQLWGSDMPYSIFFDEGIAIHQAPEGTEGKLGSRASGGCVRVGPDAASYIFEQVKSIGQGWIPKFARSGSPLRQENGDLDRRQGYKTLIIVEDLVTQ